MVYLGRALVVALPVFVVAVMSTYYLQDTLGPGGGLLGIVTSWMMGIVIGYISAPWVFK